MLLAAWSVGFLSSNAYQSGASRVLDAERRERASRAGRPDRAAATAPAPGAATGSAGDATAAPGARGAGSAARPLERGRLLGRLEIPRLHMSAMVAEGVDLKTLGHAVGHVPETALPGRAGNCALAGHRDSFLRGLGRVRPNDVIRLVTPERTYDYQVQWRVVVDPHRVDVMDPTRDRSLTLITCYPFTYVGHAPKRFIVRARQVEPVALR